MKKQTLLLLVLLSVGIYNSSVNAMCCKRPDVLSDEEEHTRVETFDVEEEYIDTIRKNTLVRSPLFTNLNELLNMSEETFNVDETE